MKPKIEIDISKQSANIQKIIHEAIDIIDKLSGDKINQEETKVFILDDIIWISVEPIDSHAIGIYLQIWDSEDLAVGVSHGSHKHFDKLYPGSNIAEAAINHFRDLLLSEQSTTVTLKKGKPYSWESVFYLNGKEIGRFSSTAIPSNPFTKKSYDEYTYSYL
jgi:hypothetical protein